MSSSIMSSGEPDLDEIALQIALLAMNLALENDVQTEDDDYDYVGYEDLHIPYTVEEYDEPDLDEIARQIALLVMHGDHDQPR
ncbi:hypothetical protein BGZ47_010747 [Haplosporangium gracile]|nr:hypothetical protein BGZ47_010747 [Haplosporangium gracile]